MFNGESTGSGSLGTSSVRDSPSSIKLVRCVLLRTGEIYYTYVKVSREGLSVEISFRTGVTILRSMPPSRHLTLNLCPSTGNDDVSDRVRWGNSLHIPVLEELIPKRGERGGRSTLYVQFLEGLSGALDSSSGSVWDRVCVIL